MQLRTKISEQRQFRLCNFQFIPINNTNITVIRTCDMGIKIVGLIRDSETLYDNGYLKKYSSYIKSVV
jgi:nucleoside 2-deoxyribosyltransferase